MDGRQFDAIVAKLAPASRRSALRSLGGGAIAAALTCLRAEGGSAAKCLRLGQSCHPNGSGRRCCKGICGLVRKTCCLTNGARCEEDRRCCTRTCASTPQGKRCRCPAGADPCADGNAHQCDKTASDACFCFTGSNGTICGEIGTNSKCVACTVDSDCDSQTGAGSVCVPITGTCTCDPPSATACAPPCGASAAQAQTQGQHAGGIQVDGRTS